MSRKQLARRIVLSLVAFLIIAVVSVVIIAVATVRQSFPKTAGELEIEGLTSEVTVLRDDRGIPTIYADNAADLFRAQGFVHAQDRFFEMDLRRHVTAGRLSELVGEGGVETDKVIRTMGWRRVAEQELPKLAPETRQYLQAYADGVNAYIHSKDTPSQMALEYQLLMRDNPGYRIEDWGPVDSLAWLKAMAWDLRGDYDQELTRARLSRRIDVDEIGTLYPPYPAERNAPILSDEDWGPASSADQAAFAGGDLYRSAAVQEALESASRAVDAVPASLGKGEDIGSNSWVVSGDRTSTGLPLLANDPHLGLGIPGIWTQVNLQCRVVSDACPFQVSGFSFAGMPGVIIGHNASIAWAFTNLGPDVTDFYLEQVTGDSYLRDGVPAPLEQRTEVIKVAGAPDVNHVVRSTVHGPILSDAVPEVAEAGAGSAVRGEPQNNTFAVSLAWTALTPNKSADAIFALDRATDWEEFRAAARKFAVPSQNLLYADTTGSIGYQAPGLVPIRRSSTPGAPPGFWPAPGWDSQWDWDGWVPFERMPWTRDPQDGFIVTANQAVTESETPFLTSEWDYGFRAQRIRELLAADEAVTPDAMREIQGDTQNTYAPSLVDDLLAVPDIDEFTAQAVDLLRDWDGSQPSDGSTNSAAAAYYNAVWKHLLIYTFDELPADMAPDGNSRWMVVVENLLQDPTNWWWDDRTTPGAVEGSGEILKRALVDARLDLARKLGKDPETWQWGRLHQLNLEHQVMSDESVPGLVRRIFERGGIELGGGSSIVNANNWNASEPGYEVYAGPSMRMVVDLSNLDGSTWVNSTGQSGHPYNDHYSDQIDAWAENETFPWPFTPQAVADAAAEELVLRPVGAAPTEEDERPAPTS